MSVPDIESLRRRLRDFLAPHGRVRMVGEVAVYEDMLAAATRGGRFGPRGVAGYARMPVA